MNAKGRLLLALALLWLLLSGHFDALLLCLGAVSTGLVLFIVQRMNIVDDESHPSGMFRQLLRYYPWLFKEVADSAIRVARIIIKPGEQVRPTLGRVMPVHQSQVSRVILANSITLTPGTVTLDASEDQILVHALTQERADDLQTGDMARRIPKVDEVD